MADLGEDYFARNFNTPLSADEEGKFQSWLGQQSLAAGYNKANDLVDYDLRGAWKAGQATGDIRGHLTDEYKKPNHPTFSTDSIYHGIDSPLGVPFEGGKWSGSDKNGWSYAPSPFMLQYTTPPEFLRNYFQRVEPGSRLVMPK